MNLCLVSFANCEASISKSEIWSSLLCNMTLMLCSKGGQATRLLNFGSIAMTTETPSCSSASRNIKPYEPSANPLSLVPFSITKQLSSS